MIVIKHWLWALPMIFTFIITQQQQSDAHGYNSPLCASAGSCFCADCNGPGNEDKDYSFYDDDSENEKVLRRVCAVDRDIHTFLQWISYLNVTPETLTSPNDSKLNMEYQHFGENCPFNVTDANKLIDGISRSLHFFKENYHFLNHKTDYGTGLTILNGQVKEIMVNRQLPLKLQKVFNNIMSSSGELSNKIFEMAKTHEKIASIINGVNVIGNHSSVWISPKNHQPWKSKDVLFKYKESFPNIGNEVDSHYAYLNFKCLVSLVSNCDIPIICRESQMENVHSRYRLTHQILYLQFAEQMDCVNEEKNRDVFKGWTEFRDGLCAKAYQEAEFLAKYNFPIPFRHLFVQQVTNCGSAGYPNFFRSDWLNTILSWQSEGVQGCVPDFYGNLPTTDKTIAILNEINGKESPQQCLTRMTSMHLSALALNLRYMVESCSTDIFNAVI